MMEFLEPIGTFIKQHGFPIFVATFLLVKVEVTLVRMWRAQKRTNVVLAVLVKVLTDGNTVAIPEEIIDEVSGVVGVAPEGD